MVLHHSVARGVKITDGAAVQYSDGPGRGGRPAATHVQLAPAPDEVQRSTDEAHVVFGLNKYLAASAPRDTA